MPGWTPDGKAVITFDVEALHAIRIEVADPSRRTPIAPRFWDNVTMRGGSVFAARFDKPGVWQIDKGERLIGAKYPARWDAPLAFRGDDVLIPDFKAMDGPRILAQPVAGGADRVLAYAPGAGVRDVDLASKMVVNPKNGEIIYAASVQGDTNIDLLTLAKH